MPDVQAVVEVDSIDKSFGATHALKSVTASFLPGSVHAVVGENGAGKSTLGKVLFGALLPDSGTIRVNGEPTVLRSPADALSRGLVGVAQELSLLPSRSVVDNLVLGMEHSRGPLVDGRANRAFAVELLERAGFDLDLDRTVGSMSVADQQKVEIARALGRNARFVVLDEPTARLSTHEAMALRSIVRDLADKGAAVVYVSHFLEEVLAVADTVTVLRDGSHIRTGPAEDETHDSLVAGMTGRKLDSVFPAKTVIEPDAPVVLDVDGLRQDGVFDDVSFSIRRGEIVGFAGLVGAGRSEVALAVYGASKIDAGTASVNGVDTTGGVTRAITNHVSLIPESRRDQGLVFGRSVKENTTLPYLDRFRSWFGVKRAAESTAAVDACAAADVKSDGIDIHMGSLSGGNQQKVLFARAMMGNPEVLIADEPTRGVDVGAKRSIYGLITDLAASGRAVLLISSEIEEIIGLSHRVLVMRQGKLVGEFAGDNLSEANILHAAFGAEADNPELTK